MADTLTITLAQLNQKVGDLAANAAAMLTVAIAGGGQRPHRLSRDAADRLSAEDLLLKPALIERRGHCARGTGRRDCGMAGPAMLVGSVFVRDGALHNGVAFSTRARWRQYASKWKLPNYGTFDEKRYFLPGALPEPVLFKGVMLGLPICEDIWHRACVPPPCRTGADYSICINGSPYEIDKDVLRIEGVAKRRAIDTGIPLVFVNRVGGRTRWCSDGASFVVGPEGALWVQMPDWEEALVDTVWNRVPLAK